MGEEKKKSKKKKSRKESIDEAVISALNEDLPPGVDYYDEDGKLSTPETDREYMNGGKVRGYMNGGKVQGYMHGGKVRAGDVRFNNKRGQTY